MDRSFSSPYLTKSPFSPRSRQSITDKRVVPSSFRKSSRFSVSGRSTQSLQVIFSTPHNYVERFGQPLPVLITEALTFAERNTVVSARISNYGFAWVVCGRRLLIWQYKQSSHYLDSHTPSKKSHVLNQCFELQLPQSDLAHRAELVSVFVNSGSNTPSCIAVSPEGVVRYWPAIVHEGVSVEQQVSLQGQECDSLTDVEGLGCILATTTCTILLIQPQLQMGRHGLKCKILKMPSGWLGGITRRMSSLIYGPISTENSSENGMVRILSVPNTDDTWSVYVLADHNLQKWVVSKQDTETFIFVAELNRMVRDNFRAAVWETNAGDQAEIDIWLLDIQSDKDSVIILAAAANIPISPRIHYAMISVQTNLQQPPTHVKDFVLLKLTDLYRENANDALSYRFLVYGTYAYLYNQKSITVVKPQEETDTLEFNSPEDFLLAGSICVNTPVFFSRIHGLVAVAGNEMANDLNLSTSILAETSISDNVVVNNLSIYNMDPEEMSNTYKDTLSQLKAAFIFCIRNQEQAYLAILQDIFPIDSSKVPGIDSLIDKVTVMMCKDLVDDIPAGDPRWNIEDAAPGIGSSYSMQVLHQLEDKQKALGLYIKFLKESGLWGQLVASTLRNSTVATIYIFAEFYEKIIAAIALKNSPKKELLEKAIDVVVTNLNTKPTNGLTNQDIFFREISQIHKGIQELVNNCEDVAHSSAAQTFIIEIISGTNEILLSVFHDIAKWREQNANHFKPSDTVITIAPEYLPWTVANGSEGLLNILSQMHYLTYNYGVILSNNDRSRNDLLDQLVALTDVLLEGQMSHLKSVKGTVSEEILYKQYHSDRQKFMKPLIHEKEWERAAQLAEKYFDFDTLMLICECTNNQRRLDEYLERFSNQGFSEFVYNWFLKENKQGKLINMCKNVTKSKNIEKLTTFLSDHPSLAWMQEIFDKKYNQAADTLHKLGMEETDSITRQKTMLSLCKLAKLAGGSHVTDDYIKAVESKLNLIAFQEEIPDYVLQQFGYDTIHIRVINPIDLISLYICPEYKEADELEFKKALDLLEFIDEPDLKQELLLKIWRTALLRDSWDHTNLDSPLELLQNKLFFKLIELAMILDGNCWSLLPPLEALLDDDSIKDLQANTNFQFLMKTGYEQVFRSQNAA